MGEVEGVRREGGEEVEVEDHSFQPKNVTCKSKKLKYTCTLHTW